MKKLFNPIVRAVACASLASRLVPTKAVLAPIFILLFLPALSASADTMTATAAMENTRNPLMLVRTSRGDVFVELFPESAPRNVTNFMGLADAKIPMFDITTGATVTPYFYDNISFHRILPYTLIQGGAQQQEGAPVPEYQIDDEINAVQFGLNDEKVLDETGAPHPWLNLQDKEDFDREILVPLYRRMGISTPEALENQQFQVLSALRAMTLQQAYENQGFRYNERLVSRAPLRGSVGMASAGPNTNQSEFFIANIDMPWLAGRTTIIGQVVEGLDIVDRINQSAALRGESTTPSASTRTMIFDIRKVNATQ